MNIPLHSGLETPPKILYVDRIVEEGRKFFEEGMGDIWFEYELCLIDQIKEAERLIDLAAEGKNSFDLVLISNNMWLRGGIELVEKIRASTALSGLMVYCVTSCLKKANHPDPQCFDENWRDESDCNKDLRITSAPFKPYLATDHPARIDGTICGDNLSIILPQIKDEMIEYWFSGS